MFPELVILAISLFTLCDTSQVHVKYFLRDQCVMNLRRSVELYEPESHVIVAGDGVLKDDDGVDLRLPFDTGTAEGKNELLAGASLSTEEEHVFMLDSDVQLCREGTQQTLLNVMRKARASLVAARCHDSQYASYGSFVNRSGVLEIVWGHSLSAGHVGGCFRVHYVKQCALVMLRRLRWDPFLKNNDHWDMFLRLYQAGEPVYYCPHVQVLHAKHCEWAMDSQLQRRYKSYRFRWRSFLPYVFSKWNLRAIHSVGGDAALPAVTLGMQRCAVRVWNDSREPRHRISSRGLHWTQWQAATRLDTYRMMVDGVVRDASGQTFKISAVMPRPEHDATAVHWDRLPYRGQDELVLLGNDDEIPENAEKLVHAGRTVYLFGCSLLYRAQDGPVMLPVCQAVKRWMEAGVWVFTVDHRHCCKQMVLPQLVPVGSAEYSFKFYDVSFQLVLSESALLVRRMAVASYAQPCPPVGTIATFPHDFEGQGTLGWEYMACRGAGSNRACSHATGWRKDVLKWDGVTPNCELWWTPSSRDTNVTLEFTAYHSPESCDAGVMVQVETRGIVHIEEHVVHRKVYARAAAASVQPGAPVVLRIFPVDRSDTGCLPVPVEFSINMENGSLW